MVTTGILSEIDLVAIILSELELTISIALFVYATLAPVSVAIMCIIIGFIFLCSFFYHIYRYPYLHGGWLSSVVEKVAQNITEKGRYSSKPVIINKGVNKRFVTSTYGLTLIFKKDKVIGRVSQRLHKKLGAPKLDLFFNSLIEEIINYEKNRRT